MQIRRFIILLAMLVIFAGHLHAQVKVGIGFGRRLYVLYEPIPITVVITNLSGHELTLSDDGEQKWFSFQVTTEDGQLVPPLDLDYKIPALTIPAGATVRHTWNLTTMYGVHDLGIYRFRASVYSSDTKKYVSSEKEEIQIADGKLFWQENVGVPQGSESKGAHRLLSLLTFRQPKYNVLYARVEDKDTDTIYATTPLGILISGNDPDVKLDKGNILHVLQLVGARSYLYSRIGLDGTCDQQTYNSVGTKPELKKDGEGEVYVSGGRLEAPATTASSGSTEPAGPKLSDRPPGFPAPGAPGQ